MGIDVPCIEDMSFESGLEETPLLVTDDIRGYGAAATVYTLHPTGGAAPQTTITIGPTAGCTTNIRSTVASTTTGTGALIIGGGLGVVGQVTPGSLSTAGVITTTNATASTTTGTGAVIVTGGVGIGGQVTPGSLTTTGVITTTNATASTTTGTGAVIVTGGVGIGGQVTPGSLTTAGVITTSNATASTSSTTGALIVTGGVGIGGVLSCAGESFYAGQFQCAASPQTVTIGWQPRAIVFNYSPNGAVPNRAINTMGFWDASNRQFAKSSDSFTTGAQMYTNSSITESCIFWDYTGAKIVGGVCSAISTGFVLTWTLTNPAVYFQYMAYR